MIQIEFKTEVALEMCPEDYGGYFITTTGRIFDRDDDDEKETNIGTIEAVLIDAARVARDGRDLWFEADSMSGVMDSLVCAFYENGRIKDDIVKGWGERLPNLLYIDSIEITPRFRGRGIGLAAIQRVVEVYSVKCDVAALLPSPILRSAPVIDSADKKKIRAAITKLRSYYRQLGFRSVPGTDFMVLDLAKFRKNALLDPALT